MWKTRTSLQALVVVFTLLLVTLPACGWRRMAHERHEQSQRMREQEIQRRELELNCLKRKEADPKLDCSQFQRVAPPAK